MKKSPFWKVEEEKLAARRVPETEPSERMFGPRKTSAEEVDWEGVPVREKVPEPLAFVKNKAEEDTVPPCMVRTPEPLAFVKNKAEEETVPP